NRHHAHAHRGLAFVSAAIEAAGGDDHGDRRLAGWKSVVAPGDPAGDLEIDEAVTHAVARDCFTQHHAQRRIRHGSGHVQRLERAVQARHVPPFVDQVPVADLADLVNAVGKLIAAVFDVDHRVVIRAVASVDVGDAQHESLTYSKSAATA